MKYRMRTVTVEATQWFKNGDHPEDNCETFTSPETGEPFQGEGKVVRYFRHPDIPGERLCKKCKLPMHEHGWIDAAPPGHTVCPGDWIITKAKDTYIPCRPRIFEATYEAVKER